MYHFCALQELGNFLRFQYIQRFDLTQAAGGNSSNIHVDWMIGSGELDIDGITQGGDRVPVMRSGEWAYE